MLDARRHQRISRYQRDATAGARLHERYTDVRPVRMARGAVADHRHETSCIRPYLNVVGGAEHHFEHRPTGSRATTSIPAARSTASSPTPESMSRCADSIAPADSTIRSAVAVIGPPGPIASTPTARLPEKRSRTTRVWVISERFARSNAGNRYAAPEPVRTPSTMLSGTAPTPGGKAEASVTSLRSDIQGNPACSAATTKDSVLPTISRARRTGIGPESD